MEGTSGETAQGVLGAVAGIGLTLIGPDGDVHPGRQWRHPWMRAAHQRGAAGDRRATQNCTSSEIALKWNQYGRPGLVWRGTWQSSATYAVRDAVTSNGTSYVSLTAGNEQQPPGSNWQVLAAKGATGATGPAGPVGPAGPAGATGAIANGWERISATSTSSSSNKSISASCSTTDKYAVGGGFETSRSDVYAQRSYPSDSDTWTVDGVEGFNVSNNWTVTAYVICVNK